jgi:Sigma 54 modulation/S30EA ribosomal protein C terminus
MAEPARLGLRPARRSGLTSPGPVRTRHRPDGHLNPRPPSQEPRTSRRTGERRDARARIHPGELLVQESAYRNRPVDRGLAGLASERRASLPDLAVAWLQRGAAAIRLEAAGQPFLFFVNAETGRGNLIYHRYDGHYGLIAPVR